MTPTQGIEATTTGAGRTGWSEHVRIPQWDNIAFWLYALLIANGAFIYFSGVLDAADKYPTAVTLALILQTLYTMPFVWFFIRRDRYDRQHGATAGLGFFFGGLVSAWVIAQPANGAVLTLYSKLVSVDFATTWGAALTAPIVEETAKFAGIVLVVLLARNRVRSVYDGMLLGAFTGLGFQVFENYQYMVGEAAANFGTNQVNDVVTIFVMRAATGIWSHALYSAIAGAGLGYFLAATDQSKSKRVLVAIAFLLLAMVLHGTLDSVAAVGVLAVPLTVIFSTVAIVTIWRFADRRQRRWIGTLIEQDVSEGFVSEEELELLIGSRKELKHRLKAIKSERGNDAAELSTAIFEAQVSLADSIAATGRFDARDAINARAEIERLREEL